MATESSIKELLIAGGVVILGALLAWYGLWRMDRALLISRHLGTVALGCLVALAGTAYIVQALFKKMRNNQ